MLAERCTTSELEASEAAASTEYNKIVRQVLEIAFADKWLTYSASRTSIKTGRPASGQRNEQAYDDRALCVVVCRVADEVQDRTMWLN